MTELEDRRRERILSIPNALGALSVALMVFVLSTLLVLDSKVARLEVETAAIKEWRASYIDSPWNTGQNVRRWLHEQEGRLDSHERRLNELDERLDRLEHDRVPRE